MKKTKLLFTLLLAVVISSCNNANQSQKTETDKTTVTTQKKDNMTPEQLGTEMGKLAARSLNFLNDKLGVAPTINDELKKNVKTERKEIFALYIPMINAHRALSPEDKQKCDLQRGISMVENIDDLEAISETIETTLGTVGESGDENFIMDVLSLYMIQSFTDEDTFTDEEAPNLPKHVGLE